MCSVLKEIKDRFQRFTQSSSSDSDSKTQIPGDLRPLVFSYAVKYGGKEEYEKVMEIYRKPKNPSDKIAAMYALCAPMDQGLLNRSLSAFFLCLSLFFFGRDVGGEAQTESILLISFFDTDFFFVVSLS